LLKLKLNNNSFASPAHLKQQKQAMTRNSKPCELLMLNLTFIMRAKAYETIPYNFVLKKLKSLETTGRIMKEDNIQRVDLSG